MTNETPNIGAARLKLLPLIGNFFFFGDATAKQGVMEKATVDNKMHQPSRVRVWSSLAAQTLAYFSSNTKTTRSPSG